MSDIDRDGSLDADEFAVVSAGLVPNTHSHALSLNTHSDSPLRSTLTQTHREVNDSMFRLSLCEVSSSLLDSTRDHS